MTQVRNKIGFHFGSQSTATGWGEYVRRLDDAGIPAVLMSVGGEGFGDIAAVWDAGSTVPHVVVIRSLSHNDVPLYGADYQIAVDDFLNRYIPTIGNDVKKYHDRIIFKMGNELDKNHIRWLADFYELLQFEFARRMGWDNVRIACFSFAAGEPEPEHWETILPFIELAGNNPDKFVFSLHEYSYSVGNIWARDGHLVGRFKQLYDICDTHGIKRPLVVSHEWGWEENEMPSTEQAMSDIDAVAALYANYPTYLGAGIWTLQKWHGTNYLSNKVQKLIQPVTNLTLSKTYPCCNEPEEPPMDCHPRTPYKRKYLVSPQNVTLAEWLKICEAAFPDKNTVSFSYDDAGHAPNVISNTAVLYGIAPEDRQEFIDWYSEHYPQTTLEFAGGSPELEIINVVDNLPKHATLKYPTRPLEQITTLTVHHTVSPPDRSIESLATYHVNSNGWPGIGYHFVIKDTGVIYQTNHLTTKSYHAGSYNAPGDENAVSVGISLQGDFTNNPPPKAQQDAARALVGYLKGLIPSVTAVLGHRQMPGASTACPGNTYKTWLPYVAGGEIAEPDPPVPPTPPPAQTVDMLPYFSPPAGTPYGPITIKDTNWGQGQVRQQVQSHGDYLYVTKGKEFEARKLIGDRIFLITDDSPGNGKYYTVQSADGWIPRHFTEGQSFTRKESATFYYKSNCNGTGESSNWTNVIKFTKFYPTWQTPGGMSFSNVCHLQWLVNGVVEEDYFVAPHVGYVLWKNKHGRQSYVVDMPQGQGNNTFDGACYWPAFGKEW